MRLSNLTNLIELILTLCKGFEEAPVDELTLQMVENLESCGNILVVGILRSKEDKKVLILLLNEQTQHSMEVVHSFRRRFKVSMQQHMVHSFLKIFDYKK